MWNLSLKAEHTTIRFLDERATRRSIKLGICKPLTICITVEGLLADLPIEGVYESVPKLLKIK